MPCRSVGVTLDKDGLPQVGRPETQVMLLGSILLALAKAGNMTRLASPCWSAIFLPVRPCGLLMLYFFNVTIDIAERSLITNTAAILFVRMGCIKIDQTAEIRDTDVVSARCELAQRITQAEAAVDLNVQVVVGEASTLGGGRPYRLRALESPIHNEVYVCLVRHV